MLIFLLTDIENPTPLWDLYGQTMLPALLRHNAILEEEITGAGGRILESRGDGVVAVFEDADPLPAVLHLQRRIGRLAWFNELQRISTSPEMASQINQGSARVDVSELAKKIRAPTLVLHARQDAVVPFEEGCRLAGLIPGARFVSLEGKNHLLLENEPAWGQFLAEVRAFLVPKNN